MTQNTDGQVLLTWSDLKALGWPLSRTHTVRKMQETIEVTGAYGKEVKVIPNPDRFPQARKLGWHRNSPLVWVKKEVLEYLKRHGINV
jgi:hypothetical protein